ncbi:hypothetical protein [Natronospora cellulosivora (SeqCode)]
MYEVREVPSKPFLDLGGEVHIISILLVFMFIFNLNLEASSIDITGLRELILEGEEELILKLDGAEIYFDHNLDSIYISDELKVYRSKRQIEILAPERNFFNWFNRNENKYKILIGTANEFEMIDINAGGISISGTLRAKKMKINAGGIALNGEYYIENFNINGAGISMNAYIDGENLSINGAGIDLVLQVLGLENISVNGIGINARLEYIDTWKDLRSISLKGIGGDLKVLIPSETGFYEDGRLNINTSGFVNTSVDYY